MVVLDTDHASLLEWKGSPEALRINARLDSVPPDEQATTIITYEEQTRGWLAVVRRARSLEEQVAAYDRLVNHVELYRKFQLLRYDRESALRFLELQRERLKIGTQDLKIAAICLRHDATLLTRNLRDFRRVPGLKAEDWSK